MTVILQNARFLHVPKTGGTWVRTALLAGCPHAKEFWLDGSLHVRWFETPGRDLLTFGFVRHPLSWWRSVWRFHKGPARKHLPKHRVFRSAWDEDFTACMRKVTRQFPGDFGAVITNFLGPIGAALDFVGRQENLVEDLLTALRLAGEPHDEAAIRAVAAANVSAPETFVDYTDETRAMVLASEREVIERFGYDGCEALDPAARVAVDAPVLTT